MLKRILVRLGGTDYTVTAINQAVPLAMAHNAELSGVSIIDPTRIAPLVAMPIEDASFPSKMEKDMPVSFWLTPLITVGLMDLT